MTTESKNLRFALTASLVCFVGALALPAQNPVPFIDSLSPAAVAPGRGQDVSLEIKGAGFAPGAKVNFNSTSLTPASITSTDITVVIPAASLNAAGTANVTVVNPNTAPEVGTSNVVFFPIVNATGSVSTNLSTIGMDSEPFSVIVGDFNGDGKPDIATANYCANLSACGSASNIIILLNDDLGNFSPAPALPSSVDAVAIAAGDFNGDGKLDLAVADGCGSRSNCTSTGTFTILLGDGTGSFSPASTPAVGGQPWSIAVGDFNRDGNLDLGVAAQSGTVTILLGDGTGQFSTASSFPGGDSIAVGDFNEDGNLDLIAGATLLLGDGTGNFTATYNTGVQAGVVGDFNGDGHLDIAVPNYTSSGSVVTLLGDGKGNFVQTASVGVGLNPGQVTTGDVNGDGKLDLVVANQVASESNYTVGSVSILLGDGTGNFTAASSPTVMFGARSVALGDFDSDGKLDMAVASWPSFQISILSQARAPEIGIPSALDFGAQNLNAGTTVPLTITNTGKMTLSLTAVAVQSGTNDFTAQLNTCTNGVQPGAACSLSITFTPSALGPETATLAITDDSGTGTQTVTLTGTGVQAYDAAISVNLASTQLTYPGATNVIVAVAGTQNKTATGTVTVFDGATLLTTLPLGGDGKAYWYISPGFSAGIHTVFAKYSGDANNPPGQSAPVVVDVSAVPVNLSASCWNSSFSYGQNYSCAVTVSSNAGPALGAITYTIDGSGSVRVPLTNGNAQFTILTPAFGNHSVSIQYAQQGNFAVSQAIAQSFTVNAAPVVENISASAYYAQAGTPITISVSLSSWSAGTPSQGAVSFYDGGVLLATVPVSHGVASYQGGLSVGQHSVTANYGGSFQFATASASLNLTVAP